jgi:hypothetical protein
MDPAIFLSPKPGPEPLIPLQYFLFLVIGKRWPTARMAFDAEEPGCRQKTKKSHNRWPEIVQWPANEAGGDK